MEYMRLVGRQPSDTSTVAAFDAERTRSIACCGGRRAVNLRDTAL